MTKLKLWQKSSCDSSDQTKTFPQKNSSHIFFRIVFFFFYQKQISPKTQIVVRLKNSNCDQTEKLKLWWNLNSDETQKLKLW